MRNKIFKGLISKFLCILIGTLFVLSIGITNIPIEALAENVLFDDNENKVQNEISNRSDFSQYSVENVVSELFEESEIRQCEYLYNLDDSPDYIYIEFEGGGYAVFLKENMEMLEYSTQGFEQSNGHKEYKKLNSEFKAAVSM